MKKHELPEEELAEYLGYAAVVWSLSLIGLLLLAAWTH